MQMVKNPYSRTHTERSDITRLRLKDDYEGVSKSLRTGSLERELQMVQPCATRCSCNAIL